MIMILIIIYIYIFNHFNKEIELSNTKQMLLEVEEQLSLCQKREKNHTNDIISLQKDLVASKNSSHSFHQQHHTGLYNKYNLILLIKKINRYYFFIDEPG